MSSNIITSIPEIVDHRAVPNVVTYRKNFSNIKAEIEALQAAGGGSGGIGYTGSMGAVGYTGSAGMGFTIAQTYQSLGELQANGYIGSHGETPMAAGQFALISNVNDPNNGELYQWTGDQYQFVVDMAGTTGVDGAVGYTGSAGYVGSQGAVGYTGSAGMQGSVGYTGSQGENGYTGSAPSNVLLKTGGVLTGPLTIPAATAIDAPSLVLGDNHKTGFVPSLYGSLSLELVVNGYPVMTFVGSSNTQKSASVRGGLNVGEGSDPAYSGIRFGTSTYPYITKQPGDNSLYIRTYQSPTEINGVKVLSTGVVQSINDTYTGYISDPKDLVSKQYVDNTIASTTVVRAFTSADLTGNNFVFNHNLNTSWPTVTVYDNTNTIMWGTGQTFVQVITPNQISIPVGANMVGTYHVKVSK